MHWRHRHLFAQQKHEAMGSGSKRKSTGQPQDAGVNSTAAVASSEGDSADEGQDAITVHLTRINAPVHEKTNVGDRAIRNGPEVSVRAGVLGYVPQSDLQALEDRGLSSGQVSVLVRHDDLSAAVTFTM